MQRRQRIVCTAEDIGVANPILNSDAPAWRLMIKDTGTLTKKAHTIP